MISSLGFFPSRDATSFRKFTTFACASGDVSQWSSPSASKACVTDVGGLSILPSTTFSSSSSSSSSFSSSSSSAGLGA
eukprot:30267-Pelagococcus_subviridis.AAC.2